MMETVADLIKSVPVYQLAAESGIPVRTLYRWAEENSIPGHEHVQAAHRQKIEQAARKLKRARKAS